MVTPPVAVTVALLPVCTLIALVLLELEMLLATLKLMLVPPLTLSASVTLQSVGNGRLPLQSAFARAIVPVLCVCALATARPVTVGGVDRTIFDKKVGWSCW